MPKNQKISQPYIIAFIILCFIGAWVSWQTILVHFETKQGFSGAPGVCNISDELNCQAVVNSEWSEFQGLPLGAYGVIFYLSLAFLLLQALYSKFWSTRQLLTLYVPILILSVLISAFLFYISKFEVKVLCPLCMILYAINALLLLLSIVTVVKSSSKSLSSSIISEYQSLFSSFFQDIKSFKISSLAEYLLSLGIISLIALSVLVGLRFSEDKTKNKVLSWPSSERVDINLKLQSGPDADYFYGNPDAPIQIVEFADFQCPFCRYLGSQLKTWLSDYQDKFYLVYLNYPLDHSCNDQIQRPFHQVACYLSTVSRCAGEQKKFWEVYYYLVRLEADAFTGAIADSKKKILGDVMAFASLDENAMQECLSSERQLINVRQDISRGQHLGVKSTPTLFVNGKLVKDISEKKIKNIMDNILGKK